MASWGGQSTELNWMCLFKENLRWPCIHSNRRIRKWTAISDDFDYCISENFLATNSRLRPTKPDQWQTRKAAQESLREDGERNK